MDAVPQRRPEVAFPSGEQRPALGLGTWRFGEDPQRRTAEAASLRQALDMGWRVIDTAEMYGAGGAEDITGEALVAAQRAGLSRSEVFVVSKVLPQHADERAMLAACEASLRRLRLDCIDLYLLHWRGGVPLAETVRGFEQLQRRGWIRLWGVSNFDMADMRELTSVPGGKACATNQVYYSLSQRGVEYDLLPWQRLQQMPLMAYSPFDQGELIDHPALRPVAERHRATPAQVALAWLLRQPGSMAIPKAGNPVHLRHNWAAQDLQLTPADLAELDSAFPPPRSRQPLAVR
jgi:diketogulonate reductase-like aldo/keto reductase